MTDERQVPPCHSRESGNPDILVKIQGTAAIKKLLPADWY